MKSNPKNNTDGSYIIHIVKNMSYEQNLIIFFFNIEFFIYLHTILTAIPNKYVNIIIIVGKLKANK